MRVRLAMEGERAAKGVGTLGSRLPGGLPLADSSLQMRLQGCKVCWRCTGSHWGRAVLLNVLGQLAQPGGAG